MKTTAKTLGDRVRERRRELGLSQPQLAKKVGGITYQAIQQLENGGGSRHLVGIARALGVTRPTILWRVKALGLKGRPSDRREPWPKNWRNERLHF